MKIYIANYTPDKIGGGHSFAKTFFNQAKDYVTTDYASSDVFFISGPTMCERADAFQAKRDGKKVVFRTDNIVRHSRNRGTGMSRLKDFSGIADLVIYQSAWCRKLLLPFTGRWGEVVLNGVDTAVFNDKGRHDSEGTYLYARSSRDEGKQWIMAYYWFVNNPGHLNIVGKFSAENLQYNFDFYNNERYTFYGEQRDMAMFYKSNKHFLYTYLNDACSNTLIEALMSGCKIIDVYGMAQTGGAPEILEAFENHRHDLTAEGMVENYIEAIKKIM